jgi:ABC-2 type transport system ATP-binding protein
MSIFVHTRRTRVHYPIRNPPIREKMSTNGNDLVVFEGVSKDFKGFPALRDVSFSMKRGEILGYVGPNGAGKTTTIKSLVGLINDFNGQLIIDGNPLPTERMEVQGLVGYLPQKVAFQEWRTVEQALSTFGRLSGLSGGQLESRITDVLEMIGLSDSRERNISSLSGGNIQKVGLAQAMLHQPKILVLDEPLAGLDPTSRYNLKKVIRKISGMGTTVFFSSHILSDVEDVADRICIVNRGVVLKIGTLDDLKRTFTISNAFTVIVSKRPEGALSPLSIEGVKDVRWTSSSTFIMEMNGEVPETNPILRQLMDMGYGIESFSPVVPNLDDLYMRFVASEVVA